MTSDDDRRRASQPGGGARRGQPRRGGGAGGGKGRGAAARTGDGRRRGGGRSGGSGARGQAPGGGGRQGADAAERKGAVDRPRLPSDVYRDLKAAAGPNVERVAADYAEAGAALEEGRTRRAITLLERCKSRAGRSVAVREALGIALYLDGRYHEAGRELATYRRLSGRQDQNHLLADCARADGRLDRAEALVDEMMDADVPADRKAEGAMVLAGARADQGEYRAALAALHRVDLNPVDVQPHHLRLWYLAGTLHEKLGERARAAEYFKAVATLEPDFLDAAARAEALAGEGQPEDPASASKRLRQ